MNTKIIKVILLTLYSLIPPAILSYTQKLIYKDKNPYGIHIHYISKYLLTLSFLPLLFFQEINLGLIPKSLLSICAFLITISLAFLGIKRAIKFKNLFFYNRGISAGFMEEFLYRGVIFGIAFSIWNNQWIALGISSFTFGLWHLKNIFWCGIKNSVFQFFYTFLFYSPIFGILRILTGDLYLSILFHFLTDATCALAPDWMRGWLVRGGRGKEFDDKYAGIN